MKSDKLLDSTQKSLQGKLVESKKKIICYRSIGQSEFESLLNEEVIVGRYDNSNEKQNNSKLINVVCFYVDKVMWRNKRHEFLIECEFNEDEVIGYGTGQYWASKDFANTKVWTGRRGTFSYDLDELYVKQYSIKNVLNFYGGFNMSISQYLERRYADHYWTAVENKLQELGFNINAVIK